MFDGAINDRELDWDPHPTTVGTAWAHEFRAAAASVTGRLHDRGWDRTMTMTSSPLPGTMVLLEHVGHGWDLAVATGQSVPFSGAEIEIAMNASGGRIQTEHRGPDRYFDYLVDMDEDPTAMERFVVFLGRDPRFGMR